MSLCQSGFGFQAPVRREREMRAVLGTIFALLAGGASKPVRENDIHYLTKYGYMESTDDDFILSMGEGLQETIRKAVLDFQEFAGIERTGVVDAGTLAIMDQSRCGVKDIIGHGAYTRRKRYVLQGSRWTVKDITYRVTKYKEGLSREEVDEAVQMAAAVWEDTMDLKFRAKSSGPVHVDIRFERWEHGDGNAFEGPGGSLAHAYSPQYGSEIHLDADEDWSVDSTGVDLVQVLVHQLGHTLGLSHSDIPDAMMAPFYKVKDISRQLHADDLKAIEAIYGVPKDRHPRAGYVASAPVNKGDAAEPWVQPTAEPEASPAAEPEASPAAESEASPAAEPEASPAAETEVSPKAEPEASPEQESEALPAPEPEASGELGDEETSSSWELAAAAPVEDYDGSGEGSGENPLAAATSFGGLDEPAFFEKDMVLSEDQLIALRKAALDLDDLSYFPKKGTAPSNNAVRDLKKRWPEGILRYTIDRSLSASERALVVRTFRGLQSKLDSCIRFIEDGSQPHVRVTNRNPGCYSSVGYHARTYYLNLQSNKPYGCYDSGTIEHETLHALGLYHHQSRSDRNNYVRIIKENIPSKNIHNFIHYKKSFINDYGLPYDYGSVMHYGGRDFGINRAITIQTLDSSKQNVIGQREGVSPCDIELVKRAYSCSDRTSASCEGQPDTTCRTLSGKECKFPFKYEGATFTSCSRVKSDNGQPWCATEVWPDKQAAEFEDCNQYCPVDSGTPSPVPCTTDTRELKDACSASCGKGVRRVYQVTQQATPASNGGAPCVGLGKTFLRQEDCSELPICPIVLLPQPIEKESNSLERNLCMDSRVDTVFRSLDHVVYVFHGGKYGILRNGSLADSGRIGNNWRGLPDSIDAAFTLKDKGITYFFKGSKYWKFTGSIQGADYPRAISEGFPDIPDNLDAAFVWGANNKIYFFKGNQYWKFDPHRSAGPFVDTEDYPKQISKGWGLEQVIEAAVPMDNGKTLFFSGGNYWSFDDRRFEVDKASPAYPRTTRDWLFGCSGPRHEAQAPIRGPSVLQNKERNTNRTNSNMGPLCPDNGRMTLTQQQKLKDRMTELLDMTADPCEDFYKFSCNLNTKRNPIEVVSPRMEDLVKKPPGGFKYIKHFYNSCMGIQSNYSALEVLTRCAAEADGCEDAALEQFGQIFIDFLRYVREFTSRTHFPAIFPDWENVTRTWYRREGWNWWDFSANKFKTDFFLAAFQFTYSSNPDEFEDARGFDIFRPNMFFAPMIETTKQNDDDLLPKIHIVPMTVAEFLTDKSRKSSRSRNRREMERYTKLMTQFLGFLNQKASPGSNAENLKRDIDRIIELELEVGRINPKHFFKSNDKWEMVTIQRLSQEIGTVPWKDFIEKSLSTNPEIKVTKHTKVYIPVMDDADIDEIETEKWKLIKDMADFIERTSERDQANLLTWRAMIMFINNFMDTKQSGGDLQENIFEQIYQNTETREELCIAQIRTFFPGIKDDMIIASYINYGTKKSIKHMFEDIKDEFYHIVDESDWLTEATKSRTLQKLEEVELLIGERVPNTPEFRELKQRMNANYLENVLSIGNYKWKTYTKSLGKEKGDKKGYESVRNAYYYLDSNTVRVKTGLVTQGMFGLGFSLSFPKSLIYGGFVSVLAHELIHGFDSKGRNYDKDGLRYFWWEPEDKTKFVRRTYCLVNQYKEFDIIYNGQRFPLVDNMTTFDLCETRASVECKCECAAEDIADNAGVKLAYRIFQRLQYRTSVDCVPGLPFTQNQLFWLGYAMDWCAVDEGYSYQQILTRGVVTTGHKPTPWRVNVVVSNQQEFAEDFKCPTGSKLKPRTEDVCGVW